MTWPKKRTRQSASINSATSVGKKYGWRSGLEETVGKQLADARVLFDFEKHVFTYDQPAKERKYTPDFVITAGGKTFIVETKGRFVTADRQKHLMVKAQYPDLDLRFVFNNSRARISKTSKTTYAMWCEKHGFQFADKRIPESWLKE